MKTTTHLALRSSHFALALAVLSTLNSQLSTLLAQGTAFTYQGRLNDAGSPVTGRYSLVFRPYNVPTGGSPLTLPLLRFVAVSNGLFTTSIDFGAAVFNGDPLWLQIEAGTNGFEDATILTPRQPLTPAPYAIFAANVAPLGPADLEVDRFNTTFWRTRGNSNTTAGTHFLGTTDGTPFEIHAGGERAIRIVPYGFTTTIVSGAPGNRVLNGAVGATIAGGGATGEFFDEPNRVSGDFSTVGGGTDNNSSDYAATVGGGEGNTSSSYYSTVGGGADNMSSDYAATVGGGLHNIAAGYGSSVPGGVDNTASAAYSFAAGRRAKADDEGSFVWADASYFDFHSAFTNQFAVRCTGGAKFVTAIDGSGAQTAGVRLGPGDTSWGTISDRQAKKNLHPVDGRAVLDKLASVPVESWNYQWESDDAVPHLGPMAQDFKAAFYPGRDDKSISTLEFDGVALAAIQGLNEKVEVRSERAEVRTRELEQRLEQKETEITELKQRLETLEQIIHHQKTK